MGESLEGYHVFDTVSENRLASLVRCVRIRDNQRLILKIPKPEFPDPDHLREFRKELEITQGLEVPGVLKAVGIDRNGHLPALLLEDFDGFPASQSLGKRAMDPERFLRFALRLTEILEDVHGQGVTHGGINPSCVLLSRNEGEVKLTGFHQAFGPSTRHRPVSWDHAAEEGFAYISPEQTGRFDRPVDNRTDFYSLGILWYELLVGLAPFQSEDHAELVAFHLARQAVPPCERNPEVPKVLSDIVMKLISKSADERYSTARALKADLEKCSWALERFHNMEPFQVGQGDFPERFPYPQKLYGRESELRQLMLSFQRSMEKGNELTLISGASGVGKSSLVQELKYHLAGRGGYFSSGKSDPLSRDLPYSAITQAFQGLIQQILTESEDRLARWRSDLKDTLGNSARMLAEIVPELGSLIGKQPEAASPEPAEAMRRMHYAFLAFLSVFRARGYPLVLFLDDLQWSDVASLDLIKALLLADPGSGPMIIGAFRGNETGTGHPLTAMIRNVRKKGVAVTMIPLRSLPVASLNRFLADLFRSKPERTLELAEAVHAKTDGNPFFVIEFLKVLQGEGLLEAGSIGEAGQADGWRWDLQRVRKLRITDNVIDLIIARFRTLPEGTQRSLAFGACMGNRFDTGMLSVLTGKPEAELLSDLAKPEEEGWLAPESETVFLFQHDRIRQAAYALLSESEKAEVHLRIGNAMLAHWRPEAADDNAFEIVRHVNRGSHPPGSAGTDEERFRYLDLNLHAARKAVAAAAFSEALAYFACAVELLRVIPHDGSSRIVFQLHLGKGECEYLNADFQAARISFTMAMQAAVSPLESAMVSGARMRMCEHALDHDESLRHGLEGLEMLGLRMPAAPGNAGLTWELVRVMGLMGVRGPGRLGRIPDSWTPEAAAAMGILINLWSISFLTGDVRLQGMVVLKMLRLSLKHGNSDVSAVAYACYGVLLFSAFGMAKAGESFCRLALELTERYPNPSARGKVHFIFASFFSTYNYPHPKTLRTLREAFSYCMEGGDPVYAGYCNDVVLYVMPFSSFTIEDIGKEADRIAAFAKGTENKGNFETLSVARRWMGLLQGSASECCRQLDAGPAFGESLTDPMEKGYYRMLEIQLLVFFRRYPEALRASDRLRGCPIIDPAGGFWPFYCFYRALILSALLPSLPRRERPKRRREILRNRDRLGKWERRCPESFRHMHLLACGEVLRLAGDTAGASAAYGQAQAFARAQGYPQFAAMASEMSGRLHFDGGEMGESAQCLRDAYQGFLAWGAAAKAQEIEASHPGLLRSHDSQPPGSAAASGGNAPTPAREQPLDFKAILKACQAMSGELMMNKLPKKLLRIILENAGAQKGVFILDRKGSLMVEAIDAFDREETSAFRPVPVEQSPDACPGIVHYAARTGKSLLLPDASREGLFIGDAYVMANRPKSILCMPLLNHGNLAGLLYLENNHIANAFTPARLEVLEVLCGQTVVSLANAGFHAMQMESLQGKIKPHFLFNALNSIAHLTKMDPGIAEEGILQLSHLYRYILTASESKMVKLGQELEIIRAYLFIEKLRFQDKLEFAISTEGDIDRVTIPGLIIQPLVENSIRHGLSPKIGGGKVAIHAEVGAAFCRITVADTGVGWGKSVAGAGYGIKSIQERLQLSFGNEYTFGIRREGGVTVELSIPVAADT